MTVRVDVIQLPSALLRWLRHSSTSTALFVTLARAARRRLYRITVPPMSEAWLRNHQREEPPQD
jgi:hypothetical protein